MVLATLWSHGSGVPFAKFRSRPPEPRSACHKLTILSATSPAQATSLTCHAGSEDSSPRDGSLLSALARSGLGLLLRRVGVTLRASVDFISALRPRQGAPEPLAVAQGNILPCWLLRCGVRRLLQRRCGNTLCDTWTCWRVVGAGRRSHRVHAPQTLDPSHDGALDCAVLRSHLPVMRRGPVTWPTTPNLMAPPSGA